MILINRLVDCSWLISTQLQHSVYIQISLFIWIDVSFFLLPCTRAQTNTHTGHTIFFSILIQWNELERSIIILISDGLYVSSMYLIGLIITIMFLLELCMYCVHISRSYIVRNILAHTIHVSFIRNGNFGRF